MCEQKYGDRKVAEQVDRATKSTASVSSLGMSGATSMLLDDIGGCVTCHAKPSDATPGASGTPAL